MSPPSGTSPPPSSAPLPNWSPLPPPPPADLGRPDNDDEVDVGDANRSVATPPHIGHSRRKRRRLCTRLAGVRGPAAVAAAAAAATLILFRRRRRCGDGGAGGGCGGTGGGRPRRHRRQERLVVKKKEGEEEKKEEEEEEGQDVGSKAEPMLASDASSEAGGGRGTAVDATPAPPHPPLSFRLAQTSEGESNLVVASSTREKGDGACGRRGVVAPSTRLKKRNLLLLLLSLFLQGLPALLSASSLALVASSSLLALSSTLMDDAPALSPLSSSPSSLLSGFSPKSSSSSSSSSMMHWAALLMALALLLLLPCSLKGFAVTLRRPSVVGLAKRRVSRWLPREEEEEGGGIDHCGLEAPRGRWCKRWRRRSRRRKRAKMSLCWPLSNIGLDFWALPLLLSTLFIECYPSVESAKVGGFSCDHPSTANMLSCLPTGYSKFDLPITTGTMTIAVTIDIDEVLRINDKDYSITFSSYFNVKWWDQRIHLRPEFGREQAGPGANLTDNPNILVPINLEFVKDLWLPNIFIYNLKTYKVIDVLTKLAGLWIGADRSVLYSQATHITFICPMRFDKFPLDSQTCKFQVGSYSYDDSKMIFETERAGYLPPKVENSIALDYDIEINQLQEEDQVFLGDANIGNFSLAGFEMVLHRFVSTYIITYYLPSGLFVIVSWISFLIPMDVIPGRMALLVTLFLVLVNIFNTVTTNTPKAEGLTAIEAWMLACILFVFGALIE